MVYGIPTFSDFFCGEFQSHESYGKCIFCETNPQEHAEPLPQVCVLGQQSLYKVPVVTLLTDA